MSTQKNEHNPDDDGPEEMENIAHIDTKFVCRRITPPTDTTGSGREGETGCGPKSGHCAECGTTEGALVLLEDTTLCEECNMADHVVKLRLIDELTAQVEALRRDGERMNWLEKNAVKELKIDSDGTEVQLDRWHRKYITSHSWTGPTLRAAIDSAQRQEKP